MKSLFQENPNRGYRKRATAGAAIETALFVSVQAVLLVCIVLVAAEFFVTA